MIVQQPLVDVLENAARERSLDEGHHWLRVGHVSVARVPDLDDEGEALAKLVLEVLCAAQALELTVDHDGETCTQRLTLLHATTGTHQGSSNSNTSVAHISLKI